MAFARVDDSSTLVFFKICWLPKEGYSFLMLQELTYSNQKLTKH
jgi:hypothetical protein